jgi:hypothetical protein
MRILSISFAFMVNIPRICMGVITLPKYKQLEVINKISYTSALSSPHWGRTLKTPARVNTRPPAAPIRNTAATFNPNATPAFESRIKGPILDNSRKGAKPSVKGMKQALISAQTCRQLSRD